MPAPPPPGGTYPLAGRPVARIGFGVMQLSGPGGRPVPDRRDALAVLHRALELGVDHFDTAYFYGNGLANALIREALAPYPEHLTIVSKIGAAEDVAGRLRPAQRPEQLRAGVEADLRSLGRERIDVVNLRRLDRAPGIIAGGDEVVDLEAQLAELVTLRDAGAIGAIGLSNVDLQQLRVALPAGIACVQNAYNLLDRRDETLLEVCTAHGIAWVPFIPLGSAFEGWPKVAAAPAVVAAAQALEATPSQVALAWLLGHRANVLLIPGTTSVAHLEENVAAGALRLDAASTRALDRVAELSAPRPS